MMKRGETTRTVLKAIAVALVLTSAAPARECSAVDLTVGSVRMNRKVKSIREIRDKNVVRQTTDYSCGAAGISTLLNYDLQDPVTEKEIMKEILKTTDFKKVMERRGFSLLDLKRFAEARGYKVTGYKMDIDFMRGLDRPVLVPINFKSYRHFIIIKGIIGNRMFVADPAMGNMVITTQWFKKIWQDGIGLVVERRKGSPEKPSLLKIKEEDYVFVNEQGVRRDLAASAIRTSVARDEF